VLDQKLLKILACPYCRDGVTSKAEKIICNGCGRRYPVKNAIPVMLVEEAELDETTE
jgi:hypothetical protein